MLYIRVLNAFGGFKIMVQAKKSSINYAKPLMVMKRDKYCKKPYHKNRFLYIERGIFSSKRKFMDFLKDSTSHWDDGEYTLRVPVDKSGTFDQAYAPFARLQIDDGKVKLAENNSYCHYLCWDLLKAKNN